MQNKLWQLAAGAVVVMGLTGCSTVSSVTDSVAQGLSKTWSGITSLGGKAEEPKVQAKAATVPVGLQPSKESGRWHGLYRMEGDAGRFEECVTGQIIPVLMEGDNVLLEQAYLNTRSSESAVMLAEVQGRVVERPVADPVLAQQGRKQLALRVERFVTLSSKAICPAGSGWR